MSRPVYGLSGVPSDQGPQDDSRGGTLTRIKGNGDAWPGPMPIPVCPGPVAQDPFLCVADWLHLSPTGLAVIGALGLWLIASGNLKWALKGLTEAMREISGTR